MRYETFVISARDSSHKYTLQGVKLLSSAPTEKAAEAGIRVGPGDLGSEHWQVSHVTALLRRTCGRLSEFGSAAAPQECHCTIRLGQHHRIQGPRITNQNTWLRP